MLKGHGIFVLSGVLGLALLCTVAGAFSGDDPHAMLHNPLGMGMHAEMMVAHAHFEMMMEELSFTENQRAAVKDLIMDRHETLGEQIRSLAMARANLFLVIHGETINETAVREASRRVAAIEEDLAVDKARLAQEIHALLAPDQLALGKARMEEWHAQFLQALDCHPDFEELHDLHEDCDVDHPSFFETLKGLHGQGN